MKREGASPRRRRRSLSALLPAALLISVLVAAPVATAPIARPDLQPAQAAATSGTSPATAATSSAGRPASAADARSGAAAPAKRPGWSVSREAVSVLVLSYVGIGALAAAGIWSYVRRGRW